MGVPHPEYSPEKYKKVKVYKGKSCIKLVNKNLCFLKTQK